MEREFIHLINNHQGIVFKVCHIYCSDEEDRKDLFQEIVLQLWKAYPSFKAEAKITTWMYRIALNTAISNYRKETRKAVRKKSYETDVQFPDFQDLTVDAENFNNLYKAIGSLSSIEKAIVLLYLDEKSYGEIAEITGITKCNVGVKLNRIKIKLEKIIKSCNYEF